MTDDQIRTVLVEILGDIAPDGDLDDLEDDESLREQLDLDSMDMLRFAQAIHTRLGVDVPELDQPRLDVLEDAVAYLGPQL